MKLTKLACAREITSAYIWLPPLHWHEGSSLPPFISALYSGFRLRKSVIPGLEKHFSLSSGDLDLYLPFDLKILEMSTLALLYTIELMSLEDKLEQQNFWNYWPFFDIRKLRYHNTLLFKSLNGRNIKLIFINNKSWL